MGTSCKIVFSDGDLYKYSNDQEQSKGKEEVSVLNEPFSRGMSAEHVRFICGKMDGQTINPVR